MQTIERKKIENVRYLFGSPSTVKSRYNQLVRTFPDIEETNIFAEPVFDGATNTIIWTTALKGNIINFSKLSPTDQAVAKKLLSKGIQNILNRAKSLNNQEIVEFVYNCIEIPSMNNIFLVRGEEDNVVLTEWGFVSDVPGMEKGLLAKIISVKRVDMIFEIVYRDNGQPAPNEKFYFEFEEHTEEHISNQEGIITLSEVKVDEEVKVYQRDDNQIINESKFVCYEGGKYKLEVDRKIDMHFKVLDEQDNVVPNVPYSFEFDGHTVDLSSDTAGQIILRGLKNGTKVVVKSKGEQTEVFNFVCEDDRENILRIKKPTYQMKIKIVDKKDNVVPNAKVKIKIGNQTKEYFSDENGFVILDDIEPGTNVNVVAIARKTKKKKEVKQQAK